MPSQFWSGCATVLSIVGLAVGIAEDESLGQKGKPLSETVEIPKAAVVVLQPTEGYEVQGTLTLSHEKNGVRIRGRVTGLTPGEHGFHIHEFGDLRAPDGTSAGGHFDTRGHKHGGPEDAERHAGDLGNITADDDGVADVDMFAKNLKIHFIIGRSIVVHAEKDDFESQPAGDAGARAALGVIGYSQSKKPEQRQAAN
ncbi:MAG: superoxide dismutase family protein [Planctomycetaceae bacterium]